MLWEGQSKPVGEGTAAETPVAVCDDAIRKDRDN